MPKTSASTSKTLKSQDSLFVYKYDGKRKLGTREGSYNKAVDKCRLLFPEISSQDSISFHTKDLDVCEGELIEIPEPSWGNAVGLLKSVTVVVTAGRISSSPETDAVPTYQSKYTIDFKTPCGRRISFKSHGHTTFGKMKRILCEKLGDSLFEDPSDIRLIYDGDRLGDNDTPASADMDPGSSSHVQLLREWKGGKPVIYLFSPTPIEASVKLSLVPQWDLSVIYPVVPIKARSKTNSNQEVTWKVKVLPNGDLKELTTGLDVAYLFWEALTNSTTPSQQTNEAFTDIFDPTGVVLNDENSVVMPVGEITPYLDKALLALGLHTEARTSFITYWLPAILKHQNIALRFVPQDAYSLAAPLDVSPSPEVITRIFMVFRGVQNDELGEWHHASTSANKDVSFWRDVVGVDVQKTLDTNLFRVLEWGGMEVVRAF